jgi:hypothetical protein
MRQTDRTHRDIGCQIAQAFQQLGQKHHFANVRQRQREGARLSRGVKGGRCQHFGVDAHQHAARRLDQLHRARRGLHAATGAYKQRVPK